MTSSRTASRARNLQALLWSEQIRHFDEEEPTIVHKSTRIADEAYAIRVTLRVCQAGAQAAIVILQVAVVAQVNRGAGMKEVGNEEVGVEALGAVKRAEIWIGEHCVILRDEAQ